MTRQLSRELHGNTTEIVIQTFADRILVLVTQLGKIQATLPDTIPLLPAATTQDSDEPNTPAFPEPPAAIQLTPLLGNAPSEHLQTLHLLYASQIATLVWTAGLSNPLEVSRKPIIVGIALRKSDSADNGGLTEEERSVFAGVMAMVQELLGAVPE